MLVKQKHNNNNMIAYNSTMQILTLPHMFIQRVIPGKQVTFETPEE